MEVAAVAAAAVGIESGSESPSNCNNMKTPRNGFAFAAPVEGDVVGATK